MTGHGPLTGIRVIDLSTVIMGPYATQILGDLGADVITIEHPAGGTYRGMSPGPHQELSGIVLNLLRNKRNLSLDLKIPEARDALNRLIQSADVLVTNLRPKPLARMGLSYEAVQALKPDIIFCQAQGYPTDSERADEPAYDDTIQASTGMAAAFLQVAGKTWIAPTIVADKVSALTVVYGILAALFERERTGQGQRIEVPMSETMTAFMLVEHGAAAVAQPPQGPPGYARALSPYRSPQRTADGHLCILPYKPSDWETIFRAVGRDDLADDPRIGHGYARVAPENFDFVYGQLQEVAPRLTTAEWKKLCLELNIPFADVVSFAEMLDELPCEEHPVTGAYRVLPQPVRFSCHATGQIRHHADVIGASTAEVLREVGFDEQQISNMLTSGAAKQAARMTVKPG